MPTYEYQCTSCGHAMEAFQKMTDEPLTTCPVCHQTTLAKLVSAAGFQLKGSGWYKTDYASQPKPASTETDKKSSGTTDSTTKTDGTTSSDSSSGTGST